MKKNKALKAIEKEYPALTYPAGGLYPTGFEDAIIGVVERFGMEPVILLDKNKVLSILIKRDKMTWEEALEYYDFNIIGAWVGATTPCFAEIIK